MQSIDTDVQSLGSQGGYGLFSNGYGGFNPLIWLITLGFLRGRGGFLGDDDGGGGAAAGVLAGQTQSKLDCLSQQHQTIQGQLAEQNTGFRFSELNNSLSQLLNVNREVGDIISRESNATQRQLAECCCDIRREIALVNTAIALQTNEINMKSSENTQKILDRLCQNQVTGLQTDNANLRADLNKAEIIAELSHHHHRRGGLPVT